MKIQIGIGTTFYEVNSEHKYAKEILQGIKEGYNNICCFGDIPKIIKDMLILEINDYLLYLFKYYENTFCEDVAKEYLKNDLLRVMKKCETIEHIKTRDKIISDRLKNFDTDDIIDYISSDVTNKIKMANESYENKIKDIIKESLYNEN